jgi:hypothetical protein
MECSVHGIGAISGYIRLPLGLTVNRPHLVQDLNPGPRRLQAALLPPRLQGGQDPWAPGNAPKFYWGSALENHHLSVRPLKISHLRHT